MSIKIKAINLGHGESIIIKINNDDSEEQKKFNILVDAGNGKKCTTSEGLEIPSTELVDRIKNDNISIHGIVMTHTDDDHIGGMIKLLSSHYSEAEEYLKIIYVVFDTYDDSHKISFQQGNDLQLLIREKLKGSVLINSYSNDYVAVSKRIRSKIMLKGNVIQSNIYSLSSRKLVKQLDHNIINITILPPKSGNIDTLMKCWKEHNESVDTRRKKVKDAAAKEVKNSSSVAFLLEYQRKKLVFGGDGNLEDIDGALKELDKECKKNGIGQLKLDLFKLLHHGAYGNNQGICDFLERYGCKKVIYSTNSKKYKTHPDIGMLCDIVEMGVKIYATNPITSEVVHNQYSKYRERLVKINDYKTENNEKIKIFTEEELLNLLQEKVISGGTDVEI